jgi:hypothetical protein
MCQFNLQRLVPDFKRQNRKVILSQDVHVLKESTVWHVMNYNIYVRERT